MAAIVGGCVVLGWRIQETRRPLTLPRIIIPPLGMSTGLSMFLYPPTRVPLSWAFGAFAAGVLIFSVPLIRTTDFTIEEGQVYLTRSRAFLWVILLLIAVRTLMREYVDHILPPLKTGAVFYLLALGMILTWRLWMLMRFRNLDLRPQ